MAPAYWIIGVLLAGPALGCVRHRLTVCELMQQPTVFVGQVIDGGLSLRDNPWTAKVEHVRFKILENFRGLPTGADAVDIRIEPQTLWSCEPIPYFSGRTYLVIPHVVKGALHDGGCFAARDVEAEPEVVSQVREYFSGKTGPNLRGKVAAAIDATVIQYPEAGMEKPLSGVTVLASRGPRIFSAVTGSDGRYVLPVPAGTYRVSALLEPYVSEASRVIAREPGCVVHNIAMSVDNTISGKVLDGRGQPVKGGTAVGLIDLDRLATNTISRQGLMSFIFTYGPDSTYEFKRVPIGRYLLVLSPFGSTESYPFESTFYPRGSMRADAKVIDVKSSGVHLTGIDLVVGKPVAFRRVSVRVRFRDGTPMTRALIRFTGLPRFEGDPPSLIMGMDSPGHKGLISLQAPADRTLRIEVGTVEERDLKRSYVATYEPGRTPISKEFVITP